MCFEVEYDLRRALKTFSFADEVGYRSILQVEVPVELPSAGSISFCRAIPLPCNKCVIFYLPSDVQ